MKKYQSKRFHSPAVVQHLLQIKTLVPLLFLPFFFSCPGSLPAQTIHKTLTKQLDGDILKDDIQRLHDKHRSIIEKTSLPISLQGTVISSKSEDNLAIILDKSNNRQRLVKVGDTIHKAKIQKIERAQVILLVNGKPQVLGQKNRKGGGQAAENTTVNAKIVNGQPLKRLPANIMPPPPPPAPAPAPFAKLP